MTLPAKGIAVLAAGGRSVRMGENKALKTFGGKPLAQWTFDVLEKVFGEVVVAANDEAAFAFFGAPVVADALPSAGPLAGIHAGLSATDAPWAFCAGCDTPFLQEEFLRFMIHEYKGEETLVPVFGGRVQPLHGIYAKCAAPRIEAFVAGGGREAHKFLETISTRYLRDDTVDLSRFAPSFVNVNTPEDFAAAEARLAGGGAA